MASSDDCYPKTVKECRIAVDTLRLEIAERTKFDSKILVHGQEDVLTLHEYEVAAKELEISMPKAVSDVFTQLSQQNKNSTGSVLFHSRS
uniref:Dynein light chain n=1 Tax=Angiostrongylus cantonensis TaxID=6313 RepID=A0A0K0CUQ1_ANGCA